MRRSAVGLSELPTYLSYRDDVLVFDAGVFLREAGLADTPQIRQDVKTIAVRLVERLYPEARQVQMR